MRLNIRALREESFQRTGDRLSQHRLALISGLSGGAIAVAEYRGSLSRYSAEKIALALSNEMGRQVEWWEIFGEDYSPILHELTHVKGE